MRILAACPTCTRQYEVRDLRPGQHFRCQCSAVVTIPSEGEIYRDALHCASCGANRRSDEAACRFCATLFTADDRERTTTCPRCFARIADAAHFCDHCGIGIQAVRLAGSASTLTCPGCADGALLHHRPLTSGTAASGAAASGVSNRQAAAVPDATRPDHVDECPQCNGLWIEAAPWQAVIDHAQRNPLPDLGRRPRPPALPPQRGSLYRPCPVCTHLMNRLNYGGASGVIIDQCKQHGVWFDADELHRILAWVRNGGLTRATQAQERSAVAAARRRPAPAPAILPADGLGSAPERDLLETGFEFIFDFIGSLFTRR